MNDKEIKLSPTQEKIFARMQAGMWYCAYDLSCGLRTLEALHDKGLLNRKSYLGSLFSPRTSIYFQRKA